MAVYVVTLLVLLTAGQLEATLQRDILTFINDLRSLHSAGPLISSPTATAIAQKAAIKLAKDGDTNAVYNSQFSTNHCVFNGKLSYLAKTCTVAWYTTMRDHSWCKPKANGKSRSFVNMIWNTTSRAGTGISKGTNGKYYVVTYFSPKKGSDVKGNVHPIKIVTKASQKATCVKGFTRFGSSCFKFHPEKVSWKQAVTICANENATLTSVRNPKEEKFLRILQERAKGKGWMWIGLHDRTNEGHFAWLDGLEFANGVCAPVSANGGKSQNCVAWTTNKPISCWSDKTCTDRYPFMCRIPVEGKSTFRTEILFLKFRWNPNFRNQNSKAFRDLRRGLRVTFKEIFQRSSGRIGGGFKSLKIKSVRPISIKGKRRGTAVTLSIQFRAKVADPTLKFQKFLRPSERLISISVDAPDVHRSAISRTMCSFPCRRQGNHYCHSWSYYSQHGYNNPGYHNTAYENTGYTNTGYQQPSSTGYDTNGQYQQCPTSCTQYTFSTCPSYCTQSCCTQTSPTAANPTQAQTTASKPPTKAKPVVPTAVVHTPAPTAAKLPEKPVDQSRSYPSYQPYNQCGTCNLNTSPYCYAFCDESCCKHSNDLKSLKEIVADMRKHLKKFEANVKYSKNADLPESVESKSDGNVAPFFDNKAKLAVKNLKRNIVKLELKIRFKQNKLKGENVEDLLFEKAIKKAEKQYLNKNVLPDFEKELEDLENDLDDIDIGTSNRTIDEVVKSAENDMEKFDLDNDEDHFHESKNSHDNENDTEKTDGYEDVHKGHSGLTTNTSTSIYDNGKTQHSSAAYIGPAKNTSTHDKEETQHSSSTYSGSATNTTSTSNYGNAAYNGPTTHTSTHDKEETQHSSTYSGLATNTSTSNYGNEKAQVTEENHYNERDSSSRPGYDGQDTTATVGNYDTKYHNSASSLKSYSGPTTNVSTGSSDKSNYTIGDINHSPSKTDSGATTNVSVDEHGSSENYDGPKTNVSTDVSHNNNNNNNGLLMTSLQGSYTFSDNDINGNNHNRKDNTATGEDTSIHNSDTERGRTDGDMRNTDTQDNQVSYSAPSQNATAMFADDLQNSTVMQNQTIDDTPTKNTTPVNDDIENDKEHKQDINPKFKLYKNTKSHKKESKGNDGEQEKYGKYIEEIHRAAKGGKSNEVVSSNQKM